MFPTITHPQQRRAKNGRFVAESIKKDTMIVEMWLIDRPVPYARNPRKNAGAVDKVAASLAEFGWKQPIVVDAEGIVIVGHTRLLAAKKLGLTEVPVVVASDLTPAQCKAYRLADNRTNEEAGWDEALLALELEDLKLEEFNLAITGFDAKELEALAAIGSSTACGLTEDDEVPALAEPRSVKGDLWILGNHRLLCGDATVITDVERLMGAGRADLVVIDPPYNVAYEGKTKDALRIQGDRQDDKSFFQFLLDSYSNLNLVSHAGASIYVFHADTEGVNFRKALVDSGWKLSQVCVWVKQSMVMGRHDYHWQHEPILYGWKPGEQPAEGELDYEPGHEPVLYGWKKGAAHRWHADRKQTTVWEFNRPSRSSEHPTMKPVAMIEYALSNSSEAGQIVVDLFGGSGSTLIACEKTARRARLMELDARYVDVIVKRWQSFTGKAAVHEDGSRFDERLTQPLAA
jgi:DNA modification methylase